MKKLSYQTLRETGYDGYLLEDAPERILQFGEGNFLRAFVDYFIDMMNEKAGFNSKVVVAQPLAPVPGALDLAKAINDQEGLYTLYLRGFEKGEKVSSRRVISCVSRCLNSYADYEALMACAEKPELRFITCNTTEAGIVYDPACRFDETPPASYPAKLTQFLYRRWQKFGKEQGKGFVILACELIDDNGRELEKCVLRYAGQWGLDAAFIAWVKEENIFCSSLVDRIVTGYPRAEAAQINEANGYEDQLLDTGEVFGFWVIEGPESLKKELPFAEAGLPVLITDNHKPYKQRKVRILNGAHTSMVLGAYLAGQDIVRDCMEDDVIRGFMNKAIYDEIIPTLDLPKDELMDFAAAVTERFKNPFIDHALLSISLNSTAKWKARVMPSLTEYVKRMGRLPKCITFSFAAYIAFYHTAKEKGEDCLIGRRGEGTYEIKDDQWTLDFYYEHRNDDAKAIVHAVVNHQRMWDGKLAALEGFEDAVVSALERIEAAGMYEAMKECLA